MMARWQDVCFLVLGLAASAALAVAQQPLIQRSAPKFQRGHWMEQIDCRVPVRPGGRLVLRAEPGSVDVRPGASALVGCVVHLSAYGPDPQTARACLERYQLKALQTSHGAYIEGSPACAGRRRSTSAAFQVTVPLHFNVDVKTEGGNVHVEKLDGALRAESAGGDIRTGSVLGPVWISTAGGTIVLGNIGGNLQARTAGGNIQAGNVNGSATMETSGGEIVAGVVNGSFAAQTAGGDIVLQAASGPVQVETAGGQIHLGECGNSVQAQTSAGNIQVAGSRGRVRAQTSGGSITVLKAMSSVQAESAAGRILAQIDANRGTFGPSRLETQVGDVDVFIPPTLPVTINAMIGHTMGRRIISDFPLSVEGAHGKFTMGRAGAAGPPNFSLPDIRVFGPERAVGSLNGGGSPLDIRTVMGNIQIRKLDAASIAKLKASQQVFWKNWAQISRQRAAAWRQMQAVQGMNEQQMIEMQKQWQDLTRQLADRAREQIERQTFDLQKQLQELNRQLSERSHEQVKYLGGEQ
ncbi:MAG: hypothetical protein ACRD11_03290 [Terriglobia bacterium]